MGLPSLDLAVTALALEPRPSCGSDRPNPRRPPLLPPLPRPRRAAPVP